MPLVLLGAVGLRARTLVPLNINEYEYPAPLSPNSSTDGHDGWNTLTEAYCGFNQPSSENSTLSLGNGKWLFSKTWELSCQGYGAPQLNYVEVAPGTWSLHQAHESQTLRRTSPIRHLDNAYVGNKYCPLHRPAWAASVLTSPPSTINMGSTGTNRRHIYIRPLCETSLLNSVSSSPPAIHPLIILSFPHPQH